ncbi:MAG: BMP family protein [Streptococcaceae bacterium]|jgi:basic membrane protein A|nr:BMP family protein [Streptococcaceae bacterium]
MKLKALGLGALTLASVALLAACGNNNSGSTDSSAPAGGTDKTTVAIVTDTGGVDDRSFNQSAWEGLQAWGKVHNLSQGQGGFNFFQSESEADYDTHVNNAVSQGFNLVYGIGFKLHDAIAGAADRNPDTKFAIVDDVIDGKKNVVSITFADNEGAYLAGVAAAKQSKSGVVGFVGGMTGTVIDRFEAGFRQGVYDTNPNVKVIVEYADSFNDATRGAAITKTMIADGVDVIYHASGGTGAGVFQEAIRHNEGLSKDDDKKVWVIGVDRDQTEEGNFTDKDGNKANLVLASTVKGVGKAVEAVSDMLVDGKFPGGEVKVFGLANEGVSLFMENAPSDIQDAVKAAQEKIVAGDITVPEAPSAVKDGSN